MTPETLRDRDTLDVVRISIPEFTEQNTCEDFFRELDQISTSAWSLRLEKTLPQRLQQISQGLENQEMFPEAPILEQLLNWEKWKEIVYAQKMGALSSLKDFSPSAWSELMDVYCQIQKERLEIAHQWASQLKESELPWAGYGLLTMIEISLASLDFNEVYLQYLRYGALGEDSTKADNRRGREYFLKRKKNKTNSYLPQIEAYPQLNAITQQYIEEAVLIQNRVKDGLLDESYLFLAETLVAAASAYGSREKNWHKIDQIWMALRKASARLMASDCPVTFIAETTIGSRAEIEPGVRVGMKTEKTKDLENRLREYGLKDLVTETIHRDYSEYLKLAEIPEIYCNLQTFTFGTNLESVTRAEQEMFFIVLHANDITARFENDRPTLKKLFPGLLARFEALSPEIQQDVVTLVLLLHEYGHTLLSNYINEIEGRLGYSELSSIVDEVKADCCGVLLLSELNNLTPELRKLIFDLWFATTTVEGSLDQSPHADEFGASYFYSFCEEIYQIFAHDAIKETDEDEYSINSNLSIGVIISKARELLFYYSKSKYKHSFFESLGSEAKKTYHDYRVRKLIDRIRKNAFQDKEGLFSFC